METFLDSLCRIGYTYIKRGKGMLIYDKFFELMKKRGLKQIDLRAQGVHPRTFQKLQNGDLIRSDTIDELCRLLDCQPGDLMEYVPAPAGDVASSDTENAGG